MLLLFLMLSSGACAFRMPAPRHSGRTRATAVTMDQELSGEDGFVEAELGGAWERAGKDKARWQPGDATGDSALDARLLFSTWVLSPPALHTVDDCVNCGAVRLVLGHTNFPFESVPAAVGAAHPMLVGAGVPPHVDQPGMVGALSICSFATAVAHPSSGRPIGSATGRPDVAAWIERAPSAADGGDAAALLDELADMLRGVTPRDKAPCLNAWGFTMDDALLVPHLRRLARNADLEAWPARARAYLEMTCARCRVPLLV